jgi:hypothetical protein
MEKMFLILCIEDSAMKERNICLNNNQNSSFAYLDAEHDFKGRNKDASKYNCEGVKVSPVVLAQN